MPRYVYLYFTTADEMTYSSDLMIDFSGFISATGGNLGLFLGFSFLGLFFQLYEWLQSRIDKGNVGKKTVPKKSGWFIGDFKNQNMDGVKK